MVPGFSGTITDRARIARSMGTPSISTCSVSIWGGASTRWTQKPGYSGVTSHSNPSTPTVVSSTTVATMGSPTISERRSTRCRSSTVGWRCGRAAVSSGLRKGSAVNGLAGRRRGGATEPVTTSAVTRSVEIVAEPTRTVTGPTEVCPTRSGLSVQVRITAELERPLTQLNCCSEDGPWTTRKPSRFVRSTRGVSPRGSDTRTVNRARSSSPSFGGSSETSMLVSWAGTAVAARTMTAATMAALTSRAPPGL
jgi:hypothetical protein